MYGANPLECNPGKNGGVRTTYDGLGRALTVVEVGCASGAFDKDLKSSTEYVDFDPVTGIAAHVTTTTYHDVSDPTRTTESTTYLDGAGRVIKIEVDDGTGAPITTSLVFNARGLVERTSSPDPSAIPGDLNTVDATYDYDRLGRITGMRYGSSAGSAPPPDAGNWDSYVGANVSYEFDGTNAIKTSSEHVTDGGPASETKSYSDFFGRLVQVGELTGAGITPQPSTTTTELTAKRLLAIRTSQH